MKNIINFLLEVSKLKEMPRTGWVLMQVRNPETVAEHTFRMSIFSWFLAKKRKLNVERAIKIALIHDLCEVYSGDITTILYHPKLSKERSLVKRKKIEMKWARLSQEERSKIGEKKFKTEKKAFLKLTNGFNSDTKRELFSYWLDYEKMISKEGKFVNEINSIETLVQSIEYFGTKEATAGTTWWESTEEIVENPLLLEFLGVIQKKFYGEVMENYKRNKELENILDFFSQIGKLKKMPRKGWVIREVKNPETMGGFVFMVALMALIFTRERKLRLNTEKLLKMTLCHELSKVYAVDETFYSMALRNKNKKERREIFKKWIRFPKEEKMKIFLENYKEEKKALKKLVLGLPSDLKKEIIQLWDEFKNVGTPEAHFLNQLHILANLFQALQYWRKDKRFPIGAFWEWALEVTDGQMSFEFMEELKKKFYSHRHK